jgi:hypothetical protein
MCHFILCEARRAVANIQCRLFGIVCATEMQQIMPGMPAPHLVPGVVIRFGKRYISRFSMSLAQARSQSSLHKRFSAAKCKTLHRSSHCSVLGKSV